MNLTTLSELQNNFNSALKNANSKEHLIENELKEINNFLNYDPLEKYNNRGLKKFIIKPESQRVFEISIPNYQRILFAEAFNNYLIKGEFETPKYEGITDNQFENNQQVVKQALEFSNYCKWLKSLNFSKSKLKEELSLNQILLALFYLGLDVNSNKLKTSAILSEILKMDSTNIRKSLGYVSSGYNNVRTEKNLKTVLTLFQKNGYSEKVIEIEDDLKKSQRKKPM